jgi:integrase/recombinase XerD
MAQNTPEKYNPKNERLKRDYLRHQHEAMRKSESTVDAMRKAIRRFEDYTGLKDFATFNKEQAIGFKKHMLAQKAKHSGKPMSKATVLQTVKALQQFFHWLAAQAGYKSRIDRNDIDYLHLTSKETREGQVVKYSPWPTLEQVRHVIATMPRDTDIDRRDRALVAFVIVSGMRDRAIASIRLKHIDLNRQMIHQYPNEVSTKFSKQITTAFFPVGDDLIQIVADWVNYLRIEKLYGPDDPVFPQTLIVTDADKGFTVAGLKPEFWASAAPIRLMFRTAFERAGLSYFNPHSFRKTLTDLGQRKCQSPEEFKAWSQNLGHESPLTTFTSYGQLSVDRQTALIRELSTKRKPATIFNTEDFQNIVVKAVREGLAQQE